MLLIPLIPANAGTQDRSEPETPQERAPFGLAFCSQASANLSWVPAFAGMSGNE